MSARERTRKRGKHMGILLSFSGRVGRSTFWWFALANLVLTGSFVAWLATLDIWTESDSYSAYSGNTQVDWSGGDSVILGIFGVALLIFSIIGLSVSIRRWHDLDKSGWWVLIGIVPFGSLYALYKQGFVRGDVGSNQYGPPPGATYRPATT